MISDENAKSLLGKYTGSYNNGEKTVIVLISVGVVVVVGGDTEPTIVFLPLAVPKNVRPISYYNILFL
jgi:hypothetical protein